jgi:hypothetical protein
LRQPGAGLVQNKRVGTHRVIPSLVDPSVKYRIELKGEDNIPIRGA